VNKASYEGLYILRRIVVKNYKFTAALIVMAAVVSSGIFAQAKNSVSLDVAPLFKGFIESDSNAKTFYFGLAASYERHLVPHVSVGGAVTLLTQSFDGEVGHTYLGFDAHGRYYPQSESMEKLFLDAGIGFNVIIPKAGDAAGGVTLGVKGGYKWNIKPWLFVEPSFGYNMVKTAGMGTAPDGWQLGLSIGGSF
jgi:hypothetical protein